MMRHIQQLLQQIFDQILNSTLGPVCLLVSVSLSCLFASSAFAASCPTDHRMYFVGANPPAEAYNSLPLSGWVEGSLTRTYTFVESAGDKSITINFPLLEDKYTQYPSQTPFYGDVTNATQDAVNVIHTSPSAKVNHRIEVTIDGPVSKIGYTIQDLDSTSNSSGQIPYQERVDVSGSSGTLSYNTNFHTINADNTVVTAIEAQNCNTASPCPIDATWGYQAANQPVTLIHSNARADYDGAHAAAYTDFYFCVAPPTLVVVKELTDPRINDSDQFEVVVSGVGIADNRLLTSGTGSTVTNGTSETLTLSEGMTYTITERVINSSDGTVGDISPYDEAYVCINETLNSTTIIPTAQMTYDAAAQKRSFTLSDVSYGDEITCTLKNSPNYIFSGTVFNDNGGISASSADAYNGDISSSSSPYSGNSTYLNGRFDAPQESGIPDSVIHLVSCSAPDIIYGTQATSDTGTYQVKVFADVINSQSDDLCLVEEHGGFEYPIRTTSPTQRVTIVSGTLNYPDNNFGRVITNNAGLVIEKRQYVNDCPSSIAYNSIADTEDAQTGFSRALASNVTPGRCIAYKLVATNRGNIDIQNVVIKDVLQQQGVNAATVTSTLANPPLDATDFDTASSPAVGDNGIVHTQQMDLPAQSTRTFYFNTQYGSR